MSEAPREFTGRRVIICVNPKAGALNPQSLVEQLQKRLVDAGFAVDVQTQCDQLEAQVSELRATGALQAVVAGGGDGTAALVANRTPPGTPLALFPLGTENLLSRYLGIAASPEQVAEMICRGRRVALDAGLAGGRLFLLMVGCGFDADVVRRLHAQRTGHIRHWSYAKPILESIRSYRYPKLRVYCEAPDGTHLPVIEARWVFIVNVPRYAGGLQIAPAALGDDGLLDVCTFRKGSLWHGLRYLGGVVMGRHRSWNECVAAQVRRLRVESDEPVPYQLDGDPGGTLPVEVEIVPGRLTLLKPAGSAASSAAGRPSSSRDESARSAGGSGNPGT